MKTVASQSERDHFRYLREQTRQRVRRSCEGEMEREVHAILGPIGVDQKISREVADSLLTVEGTGVNEEGRSSSASENNGGSVRSWWRGGRKAADVEDSSLRWSDDVGITAFLLKFGEGMGQFSYLPAHA
jgi:vacuolar iron transporter family protein